MATLQNIGKLKYRGKDGQWQPLPVVVQDAGGGVSILSGKGAPTSTTQGEVNQLYRDEDTQRLYICTATDGGYTWAAVSGGSVDVDATLTKAGYAADAKAAGDAIGGKIDAPQTAAVGEVLTVEEVDAEGKPKKWKTQTVDIADVVKFSEQNLTEEQKKQVLSNIEGMRFVEALSPQALVDKLESTIAIIKGSSYEWNNKMLVLPGITLYTGKWYSLKQYIIYASDGKMWEMLYDPSSEEIAGWKLLSSTSTWLYNITEGSDSTGKLNLAFEKGGITTNAIERTNAFRNGDLVFARLDSQIYQLVQSSYSLSDSEGYIDAKNTYMSWTAEGTKHILTEYYNNKGKSEYAHNIFNCEENIHDIYNKLDAQIYPIIGDGSGINIKSSTEGSTKKFRITVDDAGTLTATEIPEMPV